jgi:hypothetical protein
MLADRKRNNWNKEAKFRAVNAVRSGTNGIFISFKILLLAEGNSVEVREGYISFSRGTRKCAFRKNCCA